MIKLLKFFFLLFSVVSKFKFLDESITPALIHTLPGLGLSYQCWNSGIYLSKYLESHQIEFAASEVGRPMKILELGAGTGIVGIVASKLFGSQAAVIITDLPDVVPNMQKNIDINHCTIDNITAASLVWGEGITNPEFLHQDYILASDVVYYEELYEILIQTLVELTEFGTTTKIFICCEKRRKIENRFWKRIAKYFVVKMVEQIREEDCRHGYVTIYLLTRKENGPRYQKSNKFSAQN